MYMKQYACNYGIVHSVEQLLGSCSPQNVSNDQCFSTRHYYWLSQRSQDKISTSMVWLSLTLYNTNKTKYMNVMSEILKAGWLELQLVTDVLGMSPLAGNKTGFHFLQSSWSHTPPRPSSHECKSNPKTLNSYFKNQIKNFGKSQFYLIRNFPSSLLWCHNYIIHLILLVVKEIS